MRILVNASVCRVGGGVQASTAFIRKALRQRGDYQWKFAVSSGVKKNLGDVAELKRSNIEEIPVSPSQLIGGGRKSRTRLAQIEASFAPDVVFTVFGPAYMRFRAPHACGFGDGWVTHPSVLAYSVLSPLQRLRFSAASHWKRMHLARADFYCVESIVAQKALAKILNFSKKRVEVISNSYSEAFAGRKESVSSRQKDDIFRVLTIANPYPHKNLPIIPRVADTLRRVDAQRTYRFIVTLPEKGKEVGRFWKEAKRLRVESMIENIGCLRLDECPKWYAMADSVYLPTLLETFSATYPEAMQMNRPIITTDLDFAHDICGDAALFHDPLSAEDAARQIRKLVEDRRGRTRLARFPAPDEKFAMQLAWLEKVAHLGRSDE